MNLIEMVIEISDITISQIYRELNRKLNGISKESFMVYENKIMIVNNNTLDPWHTFQRCLMHQGKFILLIPIILLGIFVGGSIVDPQLCQINLPPFALVNRHPSRAD